MPRQEIIFSIFFIYLKECKPYSSNHCFIAILKTLGFILRSMPAYSNWYAGNPGPNGAKATNAGISHWESNTIVKGLPIPNNLLRDKRTGLDSYEPIREIIDGQQRIRTVLSFVCPEFLKDYQEDRDKFTVTKAHNKTIAGKAFKDLDPDTKRQILDYEFDAHILPSRIDAREIIQIFSRMNSTS